MTEIAASKDRMIAAAATLFARSGFNGVTTKDIAKTAKVSEGNIFRYFPSKRELFIAAIDFELGKLRGLAELLERLASIEDSRVALRTLFELITDTVVKEPGLVRLLQFSALEFGPDLEPVYRRHLDTIIIATAKNLEKWSKNYGFRDVNAKVTVLSFIATVVMLQKYPVFSGSQLPFSSVESAAAAYAELWYRMLSDGPAFAAQSSGVVSRSDPEAQGFAGSGEIRALGDASCTGRGTGEVRMGDDGS
jgi:DNA-binding transcriptional regulator YbjK